MFQKFKPKGKIQTTVIVTFCPDIFTHIPKLLYPITGLPYSLH